MMNIQRKAKAGTISITIMIMLLVLMFFMPLAAMAGSLDPSGPPDDGTMKTLDEIYNEIQTLKALLPLKDAFSKSPGEVCDEVIYFGLRPDGTIGEMTGTATCGTCYRDADEDLYGDPNDFIEGCIEPPGGYVWTGGDCDDDDKNAHPAALETCGNGIDENCDPSDCRDEVVLFADNVYSGNLGGIQGANEKCNSSPNKPAGVNDAVAFLSGGPQNIKDIPTIYGMDVTGLPVFSACTPNGIRGQDCGLGISANWDGLWDTTIDQSLYQAGLDIPESGTWWSGSYPDGEAGGCMHVCDGYRSADENKWQMCVGRVSSINEQWLKSDVISSCDNTHHLICVSYTRDGGQ